jgi:hypothetical protein
VIRIGVRQPELVGAPHVHRSPPLRGERTPDLIGDVPAAVGVPLRQIVESVNVTFNGQLDLGQHGSRTPTGGCARVAQRILALTAAVWHNDRRGTTRRSLLAYDH